MDFRTSYFEELAIRASTEMDEQHDTDGAAVVGDFDTDSDSDTVIEDVVAHQAVPLENKLDILKFILPGARWGQHPEPRVDPALQYMADSSQWAVLIGSIEALPEASAGAGGGFTRLDALKVLTDWSKSLCREQETLATLLEKLFIDSPESWPAFILQSNVVDHSVMLRQAITASPVALDDGFMTAVLVHRQILGSMAATQCSVDALARGLALMVRSNMSLHCVSGVFVCWSLMSALFRRRTPVLVGEPGSGKSSTIRNIMPQLLCPWQLSPIPGSSTLDSHSEVTHAGACVVVSFDNNASKRDVLPAGSTVFADAAWSTAQHVPWALASAAVSPQLLIFVDEAQTRLWGPLWQGGNSAHVVSGMTRVNAMPILRGALETSVSTFAVIMAAEPFGSLQQLLDDHRRRCCTGTSATFPYRDLAPRDVSSQVVATNVSEAVLVAAEHKSNDPHARVGISGLTSRMRNMAFLPMFPIASLQRDAARITSAALDVVQDASTAINAMLSRRVLLQNLCLGQFDDGDRSLCANFHPNFWPPDIVARALSNICVD